MKTNGTSCNEGKFKSVNVDGFESVETLGEVVEDNPIFKPKWIVNGKKYDENTAVFLGLAKPNPPYLYRLYATSENEDAIFFTVEETARGIDTKDEVIVITKQEAKAIWEVLPFCVTKDNIKELLGD